MRGANLRVESLSRPFSHLETTSLTLIFHLVEERGLTSICMKLSWYHCRVDPEETAEFVVLFPAI